MGLAVKVLLLICTGMYDILYIYMILDIVVVYVDGYCI